ncbi:protein EI24 homolog isoform X2 [Cornus florida]|uniref:protein EI24 homolog isoform X2 n=1 Tax=Cornus florida TaxID=4283 RepID=UPI00289C27F2|nr:protein EI24 homolog isoform X2 [Cornus florida]XP_059653549.1 protein EI24 homolog isoform X2 [Cornus florida]
MDSSEALMGVWKTKVIQATVLWLEGFREACCLHRVVIYCLRSRQLMIRTGQCFLLNGLIFLGSIFILKSVVIPTLQWILPDQCPHIRSQEPCSFGSIVKIYSFLRFGLVQLFYVLWFYPLYIFSIILSNICFKIMCQSRYTDIAKYGFAAVGKNGSNVTEPSSQKVSTSRSTTLLDKPTDIEGVMIGVAEQVYSVLLLSFFFLEVYVTGFIPYVGKALNFLLLCWMYAYYCFEYKWNLSGLSLERRLDFFESNCAFFAGFGSPCVLAIFFFSPLVSYGVMAILFPLFVLTATSTDADKVIACQRRKWSGAELGRVRIFYASDYLSMRILSLIPLSSRESMQDNKTL